LKKKNRDTLVVFRAKLERPDVERWRKEKGYRGKRGL